jgi:predicted RNA-binding Zn-ribbon protein involved in translation (DUF1610 family)
MKDDAERELPVMQVRFCPKCHTNKFNVVIKEEYVDLTCCGCGAETMVMRKVQTPELRSVQ